MDLDFVTSKSLEREMPYIISPQITLDNKGEWLEGNPYEKESIYRIEEGKLPPVNYDKHKIFTL